MSQTAVQEIRAGLIDVFPVAVAAAPFGFLLGALAVQKGLSSGEMALMSAGVYAGAAQFVVIGIWSNPAPWLALTLSALLVNMRHVLMGASLARKLDGFSPLQRQLAMFFMVDETWALAEARALKTPLTPAYYFGMALLLYPAWIVDTTLGTVFGGLVPEPERFGFDFAFTAIFIALIAGFWRGGRTGLVLAASAGIAILTRHFFDGPWYIAAGGLAGAAAGALTAETR